MLQLIRLQSSLIEQQDYQNGMDSPNSVQLSMRELLSSLIILRLLGKNQQVWVLDWKMVSRSRLISVRRREDGRMNKEAIQESLTIKEISLVRFLSLCLMLEDYSHMF